MKYILVIIFLHIHQFAKCQVNNSEFDTYRNSKFGIEFKYPKKWEIGTPKITNTYWVGVPKYKSGGSIVLKIIPWNSKVEIKKYSKEQYKKDILSTSIYYKDLEFIEFNNQIEIFNIECIYGYFKGKGKYIEKDYFEFLFQFWKNNYVFTIQGQFEEPSLTPNQIQEIKNVLKSIKLN